VDEHAASIFKPETKAGVLLGFGSVYTDNIVFATAETSDATLKMEACFPPYSWCLPRIPRSYTTQLLFGFLQI
jgi:hypothetical protein